MLWMLNEIMDLDGDPDQNLDRGGVGAHLICQHGCIQEIFTYAISTIISLDGPYG